MAQDPYKYFRIEARELVEGLSQGVLELEKGAAKAGLSPRLLRLAHTLKGAARVVKQPRVADLAHAIEDALDPYREGQEIVPRERIDEMLRLLDEIAACVRAIDAPPAAGAEPAARSPADDPFHTVRVEIAEMDALLASLFETQSQLHGLRTEIAGIDAIRKLARVQAEEPRTPRGRRDERRETRAAGSRPREAEIQGSLEAHARNISTRLDGAALELEQVRAAADRLRLLPASAIVPPLERAVRDAAQSLGKRVEFHVSGGEHRLDAHILSHLRDVLLHAVRNAVAHGIEAEGERLRAGKPTAGRVEVLVERRGNGIAFTCRDDGSGIDIEAVKRAAVRAGAITEEKAAELTREEAIGLTLRAGVSTAATVSEMAGRGIGLDVVREIVSGLRGDVRVRSEWGRGTSLEIYVPVSLSSLPALIMEAAGITASLPLDAVRSTLRIEPSDVARCADRDTILHDGGAIPYYQLASALKRGPSPGSSRACSAAVVVQAGPGLAALAVDRLLGTATVTVRQLPRWVQADPVVAGATLDPGGVPQLFLDAARLVEAARLGGRGCAERQEAPVPPILIIDDSLTTRMLEQSILESAGYRVDLAVSGEEGLRKARSSKYGLFIVDVEMPGMDGFTFIAETREDPTLRSIPSILVTSRSSPEDRLRGEAAGASAYIVKSEFDQGYLLGKIEELVG